jgi:CheY-like chemotaxis protein
MDAVTVGAIAAIFSLIAGTFSIVANTYQVADSIENRRKKSREATREVQNYGLVQESLNNSSSDKSKDRKILPSTLDYEPPLGWDEDIKKSFADAKQNIKRQEITTNRDCKKILVIDDEEQMRENLQDLLELEGYEVILAENAEAAFDILERKIPDLIIWDVMMPPGGDGYSFTRSVRENSCLNWIPIILMSAYKRKSSDRVTGLEAGAVAYLNKPFNYLELKAVIKSLLKQTEILIKKSNIGG